MTKRQRRIVGRSLAKFSLVGVVLVLLSWGVVYMSWLRPMGVGELQRFEVKKGESVSRIAENLRQAGLIRSPLYFRYLVRVRQLTLQAGVYQIGPSAPPWFIAQVLTNGRDEEIRLTIPEGYRVEQIAELAEQHLGIMRSEFLLQAKKYEGELFPDTYAIAKGTNAEELTQRLRDNFEKKVGEVDQQALILASLIERETKHEDEKTTVAGILTKRMKSGWPLELDATVQYARGKTGDWWPQTTLADRRVKSSYNTYLNLGLPPTPICNPGVPAIKAVQNPTDSPYWFYLHDPQGNIHYAKTVAEHNLNIDKYLR